MSSTTPTRRDPGQGTGADWARDADQHGLAADRTSSSPSRAFWATLQPGQLLAVLRPPRPPPRRDAEVTKPTATANPTSATDEDRAPITREDTIQSQKISMSRRSSCRGDLHLPLRHPSRPHRHLDRLHHARRRPFHQPDRSAPALTNRGILASALRRPFGSRRGRALIHWQAMKLWLKRSSSTAAPRTREDTSR